MPEVRKTVAYHITEPAVKVLARLPVSPNTITWFGFFVSLGAAGLIVTGHYFAAGMVILFAGFFDILDGALARKTDRTSRFGAVLDSTLDRLAEAAVLLGIIVVYSREESVALVLLVSLVLISSQTVSYIRARAETQGIDCQVGFFTRGERVIVLSAGLLLNSFEYALVIALSVIAVLSIITVGQRLIYVWRQARTSEKSMGGK